MAAHLAHETTARLKRSRHARDDELRPPHPVQRRVGEDGVELTPEGKRMTIHPEHRKSARTRRGEQLFAEIDAEHISAGRRDLGGEHAMAAAEIEDALAFCGREHGEDGTGKVGDKTAVRRIVVGRPALHGFGGKGFQRRHERGPGRQGS